MEMKIGRLLWKRLMENHIREYLKCSQELLQLVVQVQSYVKVFNFTR